MKKTISERLEDARETLEAMVGELADIACELPHASPESESILSFRFHLASMLKAGRFPICRRPTMPSLNYTRAEILRGRIADILQEMSAFTDAEEDAIENGAEDDPDYINALSDACILLDRACIQMARIDD